MRQIQSYLTFVHKHISAVEQSQKKMCSDYVSVNDIHTNFFPRLHACLAACFPAGVCDQLQDEERRRKQQLEEIRKREAEERAKQEEERRWREEERAKREAEEKVGVSVLETAGVLT